MVISSASASYIIKGAGAAGVMPYVTTFAAVKEGSPLAYQNSLHNLLSANYGNFAESYKIASGPEWTVEANDE